MDIGSTADSLGAIARGSDDGLPLALLSLADGAVREVQAALARHALLDPPSDGFLGPVTGWALREAARLAGVTFDNAVTPDLARALLADTPLLPSRPGGDLAGRLLRALERRGDWVCRHPDALTIIYVEATRPDGTASPARPDAFDDARFLLRFSAEGVPELAGAWAATTKSGQAAIEDPVDALGPPRLEPGQYKVWVTGRTAIGTTLEQEALVQAAPLPVRRDAGKDHSRAGDPPQVGYFVIDQHGSMGARQEAVGDASAGCLVGHEQDGQARFMTLLRGDARWRANNAYRFMTSLLRRSALA